MPFDASALLEESMDRVLTQYRESPKLLWTIRTYLNQVKEIMEDIYTLPLKFDLDDAVGDQLTLLGKRMGWPRTHCICLTQPVHGFECAGVQSEYPLAGFCRDDSTWIDCNPNGTTSVTIEDDEVYRAFLRVRRYQILSLYDLASLEQCIRIFWGDDAWVPEAGRGRVVIAPGRDLTEAEATFLQLYPRVLPVAPGIRIRFHLGSNSNIAGFGEGWGGFCDEPTEAVWLCETDVHPYDCP